MTEEIKSGTVDHPAPSDAVSSVPAIRDVFATGMPADGATWLLIMGTLSVFIGLAMAAYRRPRASQATSSELGVRSCLFL